MSDIFGNVLADFRGLGPPGYGTNYPRCEEMYRSALWRAQYYAMMQQVEPPETRKPLGPKQLAWLRENMPPKARPLETAK